MYLDNYKTQKSLKEYIKNIIDKIGICSSIKNNYPQYYDIFIELFYRHPKPEKIIGITDIQIKKNPIYKYLELYIVYKDGKTDDISYNVCISGKQKNFILYNIVINQKAIEDIDKRANLSSLSSYFNLSHLNLIISFMLSEKAIKYKLF